MRIFVILVALMASPAFAEGYETKGQCLDELATATRMATSFESVSNWQRQKLEKAPGAPNKQTDAIVARFDVLASEYAAARDAIFDLCQTYED